MQIKDKRVIVTGAASGAGLAFSRELLRNGALMIIMIDIRQSHGEQAVESLNNEFGRKRAVFLYCDVTNNSEFDAAFKEAINILGGLDILINNAGVINETDFSEAIDVNVTAVIRGTLLGIQQMRKDSGGKGGVVVNISSIAGLQAVSQLPVYSATKHAVVSFSRSFADPYYYEKSGVTVITLCPGLTETALTIDSPNKLLSRVMKADFVKNLEQFSIQTPYVVAQGLMTILRIGESGSIWVIESGRAPYEVYVPNPRTLRRHYKNNFSHVEPKVARGRPIREVCDNTRTGLMSCA
ncbi:hypothetical protein PUN28_014704 [Cardiocondyla obscurior]|uniref:Alcohol dehydrogenase n=1 Tax=Cardiocondyla obscurior TaxID=286306 RepID=A0AAW2EYI3_9HYME